MTFFREKFRASPVYARFAPYAIFVALTACQGMFGKDSLYWMYALKTLVGAWLIWEMRPFVSEMRWAISVEAIAIGVAVFIVWVALDPVVPKNHIFFKPTEGDVWNPFDLFGAGSPPGCFYVGVRFLGSTFIVPPLEEVFFRSLLYRYFVRTNFESLPLKTFHVT